MWTLIWQATALTNTKVKLSQKRHEESNNVVLRFRRKRKCTIRIRYCQADLCLVFAYAECWFVPRQDHDVAQIF